MQIFDVLIDEHERIERLARRLEAAPRDAVVMRRELLQNLQSTWIIHARTEEQTFYEALRPSGLFIEVILEAYAEHNSIEAHMRELEIVNPGDPRFDAKTHSLHYAIEKHFEEEESWIFEAARRHLTPEQALTLVEKYFETKNHLARGDLPLHRSLGTPASPSPSSSSR